MLAKNKLNSVEVVISKVLIDLHTSHDESLSINNVLKEYVDIKEEIKNLQNPSVY